MTLKMGTLVGTTGVITVKVKLKTPPAALPGANLLPDLIKSGFDKQVLINRFRPT